MSNSTDLDLQDTLEIKEGWKGYYIFNFFLWIAVIAVFLIFAKNRQDAFDFFFSNWTWAKLPTFLVIIGIPAICLFYYFDKRVKAKFSNDGIWTKKYGNISWQSISSFYSRQTYSKEGDIYTICFNRQEQADPSVKEIKIELRRMNTPFDEVRNKISMYAIKYGIEDLGHKKGWL